MFAIGDEELGRDITNDKTVKCPNCGKKHKLRWGKDNKGVTTKVIGFVKCTNGSLYVAAIAGKEILRRVNE